MHLPPALAAASLTLLLVAACSGAPGNAGPPGGGQKGNAEDDAAAPVPVEVASTARGDVAATYTGTAPIVVDSEATVVAKVAGEIEEILVEEGDRVASGDVLARLDGDRLRLELEQAAANLRKLEQDYERNVELHEQGLVSAGAFESLKYELDALRALHERARLEYGYTWIRAPIDGIVATRFIKVGNMIAANQETFRITARTPLLAYLYVPEREFNKLAPGQRARFRIDALGGDAFGGEVLRISPVVDPETGTFKVTLEVEDDTERVRPGMFARVSILYENRENALLVPRAAVVETDGDEAVYVVRDGVARRQSVATGFADGDRIQIVEGLQDGDQVVVVGQSGLKDGSRVDVIDLSS